MDPLTHLMTGAVLARTGFNRKAAYATLAMTLAAEAPDLDVLWSIKGPLAAFQPSRTAAAARAAPSTTAACPSCPQACITPGTHERYSAVFSS